MIVKWLVVSVRIAMMAGGFILMYTILSIDPSSQRTHELRKTCRKIILTLIQRIK